MAEKSTIPTRIESRNNRALPPATGTLKSVRFDRRERFKNAGRTLLLWFGVMSASALVPFWHYLLVPGFFVTAWVLAWEKLHEVQRCAGGSGNCPQCKKTVSISPGAWKMRMTETCESCFQDLILTVQTEDQ